LLVQLNLPYLDCKSILKKTEVCVQQNQTHDDEEGDFYHFVYAHLSLKQKHFHSQLKLNYKLRYSNSSMTRTIQNSNHTITKN